MTLVTVVTPCFEHERYLDDYFDSLLAQTHREIELVFYDDASADGSFALAQKYRERLEERFARVVLRRHERNLGLLRTLAALIGEIRGDITCILESDDYLHPAKIAKNVAFLERHPEVGLVHGDVDFLDQASGKLERAHWATRGRRIPRGEIFEDLLHENFILTCTMACRTRLLTAQADFSRYLEKGYRTADYPLFLDLARVTRCGYIEEPLAVYRVVEGSISHPRDAAGRQRWKFDYYRVKRDYVETWGASQEIRRRALVQYHSALLRLGWTTGSRQRFRAGFDWLARHAPERLGPWTRRCRTLAIRHRAAWRVARWCEDRLAAREGTP